MLLTILHTLIRSPLCLSASDKIILCPTKCHQDVVVIALHWNQGNIFVTFQVGTLLTWNIPIRNITCPFSKPLHPAVWQLELHTILQSFIKQQHDLPTFVLQCSDCWRQTCHMLLPPYPLKLPLSGSSRLLRSLGKVLSTKLETWCSGTNHEWGDTWFTTRVQLWSLSYGKWCRRDST